MRQVAEMNRIPVSNLVYGGNERKYVDDCLESKWLTSTGKYVKEFEKQFAEYLGVKHVIAVTNGTVSLHLALLALDIGPGDEVIVPSMTYVASANAIRYVGATPVLVDSDPVSFNMSVDKVKAAFTDKTKAVIAVHLFGHMVQMDELNAFCESKRVAVIEDAAEAHGASLQGVKAGAWSTIASFSFFGNKIISSGEGGALATNCDQLASKVRLLMNQAQSVDKRFWHDVVGYNYRMTNLSAAVLLGQFEAIDEFLDARKNIKHNYDQLLASALGDRIQTQTSNSSDVTWLYALRILGASRDKLEAVERTMLDAGIEIRLFFVPMHVLPMYRSEDTFPCADVLSNEGVCLPTWVGLGYKDQVRVVEALSNALVRVDD